MREAMPNLIRAIEADEIRPARAATHPLADLRAAQAAVIANGYTGNDGHTGNTVVCP